MPIQTPIYNNFTAGELTPKLEGRVDFAKYQNGVSQLENFLVFPQGGVSRRGGSQFMGAVKDSTKATRLVSFEFSVTQTYILEFGHQYIRFYKDLGQIQSGSPATAVEVTTTYTEAELFELQFTQSADILYIVHEKHPPAKLSRTSHTNWTLTDIVFTRNGSALTEDPIETINNSTAVLVTHMSHGIETGDSVTLSDLVCDGLVDTEVNTVHTVSKIDANNYEITVTTAANKDGNTGGKKGKALYPFTWTTNNYPRTIVFFEQRLWFAGTPNNPQTLWASRSSDYEDLTQGILDDDALEYTISTDQVNAIQWMSPGKVLIVGTLGGEFIVSASSTNEAVTPSNVRIVRHSTYGSAFVPPIRISDIVVYLQRAKLKLRQFVYDWQSDNFLSPDLTLLSEHISSSGIKEMALQQNPFQIIWVLRNDGVLGTMTYLRDQEVIAWSRQISGGGGSIESMAILPAPDGDTHDEIWLIVNRIRNGTNYRYIEVIRPGLRESESIEDSFFLDSGLSYNGTPTSTVTGLSHLEGETVQILADGTVHPDAIVSAGSVSLNGLYSKIHVGLSYDSKMTTMKLEAGAPTGSTAQGATKRISNLVIRLYKSLGLKVGSSETNFDTISFRSSANAMGSSVGLFTGDKEIAFKSGYNTESRVFMKQDQPLPLTLLALIPRIKTNTK